MTGIYPSYYSIDGVKKEVLLPSLRAILRVKLFQVWTSLKAKVPFDLSLKFDQEEGEIALSNMPEIDVENRKETGIWKFATTPRMSSLSLGLCGWRSSRSDS